MASLADVFRVLEAMRAARVFTNYAIGGATAVLFYAEPTRTYDLDVFISFRPAAQRRLPCQMSTRGPKVRASRPWPSMS